MTDAFFKYLSRTIVALMALFIFMSFALVVWGGLKHSNTLWGEGIIQISPIPCVEHHYSARGENEEWVIKKTVESTLCLPLPDAIGLNNSLKLAESISLLGVFVAIVGIMLPVIGFFSLKQQKAAIEANLKVKFDELKKNFETINENKWKETSKESQNFITYLSDTIAAARKIRQEYMIYRMRALSSADGQTGIHDPDTASIMNIEQSPTIDLVNIINDLNQDFNQNRHLVKRLLKDLNSVFNEAFKFEAAVLDIGLKNDLDVLKGFDVIRNLVAPEDVREEGTNKTDELYIRALEETLGRFELQGVFNNDAKREAINSFLVDKLKINKNNLEQWRRNTSKL